MTGGYELVDRDAGPVLVRVVCSHCGNKTVAVAQARQWGVATDTFVVRAMFGKVKNERGRGFAVSEATFRTEENRPYRTVFCPRHGELRLDWMPLRDAVIAATAANPRVVAAVRPEDGIEL